MIFFDVDTQHDFMDADGALAVPDAETIKPNIERLLRVASEHHIMTVSSRCAHTLGDPEFETFPPHCIEGTRGAERVFANLPELPRREIPVDAAAESPKKLADGGHYVVKKKVFDLFSNKWLNGLRKDRAFNDEACIIFGVATDYCVRACALGLAAAGARVQVVEDAIRGVAADTTALTMEEMRKAGVEFTTTSAVLNRLAKLSAAG